MSHFSVKLNIRRSEPQVSIEKVTKMDEEKRRVFGFFSVVEENGKPVIDYQGDVIDSDDLEEAAYKYVMYSRMGDERHDERAKAMLIESVYFSKEKQAALGIDLGKVCWWGGFYITDDDLWEKVKSGQYSMFSIGGRSKVVKPD